ncbi:hypothetical protein GCM10027592_25480 [Spirosoma flavus]
MKVFTLLLASAGLLVASQQVYSQDDGGKKPLYNPMYSTHNYKHPNMAKAASRWEKKSGVAVQTPTPGAAQVANYKNQMPMVEPVGGITVEHTPSRNLADRNYKIQRLSEPQPLGPPSEYYVKKPKRKGDNSAVGE